MKNENGIVTRIIFNNKLVIIISLILSFIIWLVTGMNTGEEITKKISNIPVTIELSDEAIESGLKDFTVGNLTAEVTIKGNRLSIGSVTAENIEIVASQASTITSPGTYTLELTAKKVGINTSYEFSSSVYPSTVIVTVDRARELTLPIVNELNYSIAQGYYEGTTQYSSDEVVVSGPETELSRIDKAVVAGNIDEDINETKTVNEKIALLDAYGYPVQSDKIELSVKDVDVTIPVDYKKTLKTAVKLYNTGNTDFDTGFITVSPEEIEIAAPYDELKNITSVDVAQIDMSEISSKTIRKILTAELPSGWKNISNISSITVSFDMAGYVSKTIEITKFDTSGLAETSTAAVSTKSLSVMITGKASQIADITADDISAVIDFGNKASGYSGTAELNVNINISSQYTGCWATGKYTASVDIVSEN